MKNREPIAKIGALLALFTIGFAAPAFSREKAGNGGDALFLSNGEVTLLDLAETPEWQQRVIERLKAIAGGANAHVIEPFSEAGSVLAQTLAELDRKSRHFSKDIRDHVHALKFVAVVGQDLPELDDSGIVRPDLLQKQLGLQFEDTVLVNWDIFKKLETSRKKSAFFVHEGLIHLEKSRDSQGRVYSPEVRELVRYLFDDRNGPPQVFKDDPIALTLAITYIMTGKHESSDNALYYTTYDSDRVDEAHLIFTKITGQSDDHENWRHYILRETDERETLYNYGKTGLPRKDWTEFLARTDSVWSRRNSSFIGQLFALANSRNLDPELEKQTVPVIEQFAKRFLGLSPSELAKKPDRNLTPHMPFYDGEKARLQLADHLIESARQVSYVHQGKLGREALSGLLGERCSQGGLVGRTLFCSREQLLLIVESAASGRKAGDFRDWDRK